MVHPIVREIHGVDNETNPDIQEYHHGVLEANDVVPGSKRGVLGSHDGLQETHRVVQENHHGVLESNDVVRGSKRGVQETNEAVLGMFDQDKRNNDHGK